jgi:hypothetical protein
MSPWGRLAQQDSQIEDHIATKFEVSRLAGSCRNLGQGAIGIGLNNLLDTNFLLSVVTE